MDGFPFVHRETVRFREASRHGGKAAAPLSRQRKRSRGRRHGPRKRFLARTEIDFRSPLSVGEVVEVGVRPSRLGTKSFELEYEMRADGRLVAEAKSVLVGYDYEREQSAAIPERWRERLSA